MDTTYPIHRLATLIPGSCDLRTRLITAAQASEASYGSAEQWGDYASRAGAIDCDTITIDQPEFDLDVQCCWAVLDECVVVSWRGTRPTSIPAWIQNFDQRRTKVYGGKAHLGFVCEYSAAATVLWQALIGRVSKKKLIFVGHSKGGALATLSAYLCRRMDIPVESVVTFGSPRVLNWSAARWLDNQIEDQWRIVNSNDPVPLLPGLGLLNRLRFRHVGRMGLLQEDGILVINPDLPEIVREWVRGYRFDTVRDHFMEDGYLTNLLK